MKIAEIDYEEYGRQSVYWDATTNEVSVSGDYREDPVVVARNISTEESARRTVHEMYRDWGILWIEN